MRWDKVFPGLNLRGDYALSWDEIWLKLKPIRNALPPVGGFDEQENGERSNDLSFISAIFDEKLRGINEEKNHMAAEEKHKAKILSLEQRESEIRLREKEFEMFKIEFDQANRNLRQEAENSKKLRL